mmetsp:Transcript_34100/g.87958  ORF Transcript_34100/g.87958 Transcript_34100/m.87958 type:complete len:209 (+) Transcript_34100:136-762(+)
MAILCLDMSEKSFPGDFGVVSGLVLFSDAVKLLPEGILGRGVHHLGFDLRYIGRPHDEGKLGSSTIIGVILYVVDYVSAFVLGKTALKVIIGSIAITLSFNLDGLGVVTDLVLDEAAVLPKLELVKLSDAVVVNTNSGGHFLSKYKRYKGNSLVNHERSCAGLASHLGGMCCSGGRPLSLLWSPWTHYEVQQGWELPSGVRETRWCYC